MKGREKRKGLKGYSSGTKHVLVNEGRKDDYQTQ